MGDGLKGHSSQLIQPSIWDGEVCDDEVGSEHDRYPPLSVTVSCQVPVTVPGISTGPGNAAHSIFATAM